MPQLDNSHGLAFTASSPEAVAAFDRAVMNYLSFSTETGASLKALLAIEPEMPMAQCLRGYFFLLMGVRGPGGQGRTRKRCACSSGEAQLNPRERLHAAALLAWSGHSLAQATRAWSEIARLYPRDILAVKMAHFGHFYGGDSRGVRDCVAAALDFWRESDDVYPYLLSMYAFGLEECGDPWQAEAIGRDALARQPRDPWGIHAVAHALEATGRTADGVAWIDSVAAHWQGANNFRYHLAWHQALFPLRGRRLPRWPAGLRPHRLRRRRHRNTWTSANDASLLLRLELAGADVGERWRAVAAKAEGRTEERVLAFADLHFVLALASSPAPEHRELAQRMLASMAAHAESPAGDAAVYRAAALPAAQAIVAFREGRHADAAQGLAEAAPHLYQVGGSHAQRDLFAGLQAEALLPQRPRRHARRLAAGGTLALAAAQPAQPGDVPRCPAGPAATRPPWPRRAAGWPPPLEPTPWLPCRTPTTLPPPRPRWSSWPSTTALR